MHALTYEQTLAFREAYENDRAAKTATAAAARTELADLAFVPMNAAKLNGEFTIELKTRGITAQEKSGRCWMFAALNLLREGVAEKLGLKQFEFSENYLAFYDKLEKSNNFLSWIIDTAAKPLTDREVNYVLAGIGDGGYWCMAVDLIEKYGLVPKSVMPETWQSSHTEKGRTLLNTLLRRDAAELRDWIAAGKDPEPRRLEMLREIYKLLCITFGEPVDKFDFTWRGEDGAFREDRGLTPQDFYRKYVGVDLSEYVQVDNAPTWKTPMHEPFTFHYLGNMAETNVLALNLPFDEFEALALASLRGGDAMWFACDAGAYGDRKTGVWDPDSFDYAGLLGGVELEMPTKQKRLEYRASNGTHAMLLIGVHLDENGKPDRWKIENSWGKDVGKEGYFVCSERYFREYTYELIVKKSYLTDAQREMLTHEPMRILPWEDIPV